MGHWVGRIASIAGCLLFFCKHVLAQPPAVTDFYARPTGSDTITLDWSPVSGPQSYLVNRVEGLNVEIGASVIGDAGQAFEYSVEVSTKIISKSEFHEVHNKSTIGGKSEFTYELCADTDFVLTNGKWSQQGATQHTDAKEDCSEIGKPEGCFRVTLTAEAISIEDWLKGIREHIINGHIIIEMERRIPISGSGRVYADEVSTIPVSGIRIISVKANSNDKVVLSVSGNSLIARTLWENIKIIPSFQGSFKEVAFPWIRAIDLQTRIPPFSEAPLKKFRYFPLIGPNARGYLSGPSNTVFNFYSLAGVPADASTPFSYSVELKGDAGQGFNLQAEVIFETAHRELTFSVLNNNISGVEEKTRKLCMPYPHVLRSGTLQVLNSDHGSIIAENMEVGQQGGCYSVTVRVEPIGLVGNFPISSDSNSISVKLTIDGDRRESFFADERTHADKPFVISGVLTELSSNLTNPKVRLVRQVNPPNITKELPTFHYDVSTIVSGASVFSYETDPNIQTETRILSETATSVEKLVDLATLLPPGFFRNFSYVVDVSNSNVGWFQTGDNQRVFHSYSIEDAQPSVTTNGFSLVDDGTQFGKIQGDNFYYYQVHSVLGGRVQTQSPIASAQAVLGKPTILSGTFRQDNAEIAGLSKNLFAFSDNLLASFLSNRPAVGSVQIAEAETLATVKTFNLGDTFENFDSADQTLWVNRTLPGAFFGDHWGFENNAGQENKMLTAKSGNNPGELRFLARSGSFPQPLPGSEVTIEAMIRLNSGNSAGGFYLDTGQAPGPNSRRSLIGPEFFEPNVRWRLIKLVLNSNSGVSFFVDGRQVETLDFLPSFQSVGLVARGAVNFDDLIIATPLKQFSWDGKNDQGISLAVSGAQKDFIASVHLRDATGNTSEVVSRAIALDQQPPSVLSKKVTPDIINPQATSFNRPTRLSITLNDVSQGAEVPVDWRIYKAPVSPSDQAISFLDRPTTLIQGENHIPLPKGRIPIQNGNYLITGSVKDKAGNEACFGFPPGFTFGCPTPAATFVIDNSYPWLEVTEKIGYSDNFDAPDPFVKGSGSTIRYKVFYAANRGARVTLSVSGAQQTFPNQIQFFPQAAQDVTTEGEFSFSGNPLTETEVFKYRITVDETLGQGTTGRSHFVEGTMTQYAASPSSASVPGPSGSALILVAATPGVSATASESAPQSLAVLLAGSQVNTPGNRLSDFYEIQPDNVTFSPPVLIRVKPTPRNGILDVSNAFLYRFDPQTNSFALVQNQSRDLEAGEVIAFLDHASVYALFDRGDLQPLVVVSSLSVGSPRFASPDNRTYVNSQTPLTIEVNDSNRVQSSHFRIRPEGGGFTPYGGVFHTQGNDGIKFVDGLAPRVSLESAAIFLDPSMLAGGIQNVQQTGIRLASPTFEKFSSGASRFFLLKQHCNCKHLKQHSLRQRKGKLKRNGGQWDSAKLRAQSQWTPLWGGVARLPKAKPDERLIFGSLAFVFAAKNSKIGGIVFHGGERNRNLEPVALG